MPVEYTQNVYGLEFRESYIGDPQILAEEVLKNPSLGGSLTLPIIEGNVTSIYTIPFYMEGNLSFSLGNTWKPLINANVEALDQIINLFSTFSGSTQITVQSRQMQSASWAGCEIPKFSINTTFVATRRQYNPLNILKALSATCLPLTLDQSNGPQSVKGMLQTTGEATRKVGQLLGNIVGWGAEVLQQNGTTYRDATIDLSNKVATMIENSGLAAPLNYGLELTANDGIQSNELSTLVLQIGDWFRATNLIVESISSIEISKEVIAPPIFGTKGYSGNDIFKEVTSLNDTSYSFPLYVKCNLTLRPISYVTADEFKSYFLQPLQWGNANRVESKEVSSKIVSTG